MEDFRLGTEINTGTSVTQLVNAAGESELFYAGPGATRGVDLYNVRPDRTSDTGWSVLTIAKDIGAPGALSGGAASDGTFTLFRIGPDMSNPDILFAQRDLAGVWSAWQTVDPSSVYKRLPQPAQAVSIAAEAVGGAVELAAILSDGTSQSLWRVDWTGSLGSWQPLAEVSGGSLDICTTLTGGPGVLAQQVNADGVHSDLVFFPFSGGTPATLLTKQFITYFDSALQTLPSADQRSSGIFVYNSGVFGGQRSISFIDCGVASPAPVQIDSTLACTQIVAIPAGDHPLCLAALVNGKLTVLERGESTSGWEVPIELGENLSSITAGLAADGSPLVFAIPLGGGNLYSLLQQPEGFDNQWTTQQIAAGITTCQTIPTYATTLTVTDALGNRLANAEIFVWSPETATLSCLGETFVVDLNTRRPVRTNAAGQVTLYASTESIAAAKLLVSQTATGEGFVIDPDDGMRASLAALSVADTTSLLQGTPNAADADQVQQAITAAMSYTEANDRDATLNVGGSTRTASFERPLDPASGRIPHWKFTIRNDRALFTELSAADAAALQNDVSARFLEGAADLGGFFDWLGDIITAVANAIVSAFEVVITAAETVVKATVELVVNGVTYAFKGVIETVERAFAVAESIFNAVKVFFGKLFDFFGWLISSARTDIWNTKVAFEHLIDQALITLPAFCVKGQTAAAGFFAGLKDQVSAGFRTAAGNHTFDYDSLGLGSPAANAPFPSSPAELLALFLDNSSETHWLTDKLFGSVSPDFPTSLPADLLEAIGNLAGSLTRDVGDTVFAELTAVQTFLASIAADPSSFMSSTIQLVLNTAENVVLLVLDILDDVVQALFAVVIAFLKAARAGVFEQKVGGFFLGSLYNLLNPGPAEDLTVTRFVAMLCAFPSTILYRLFTGNAPFTSGVAGALEPADTNVYKALGGCLTLFWTGIDMWLEADGGPPWLVVAGAFVPVVINGLSSPGPTPFSIMEGGSGVARATNAFWFTKWLPVAWTGMIAAQSGFTAGPRKFPVSCGLLSVLGAGMLGTGIWKGIEESNANEDSGGKWFGNVAGPVLTIAKPLRFARPYGAIALGAIDLVGDFGDGVIAVYSNAS